MGDIKNLKQSQIDVQSANYGSFTTCKYVFLTDCIIHYELQFEIRMTRSYTQGTSSSNVVI